MTPEWKAQLAQMAQTVAAATSTTRVATVTSYDPVNYAVKVKLQPTGEETGWLPVGSPWTGNGWGFHAPPSQGDQVHIVFQEGDRLTPILAGRVFDDDHRPLNVPSGEFHTVHKSGSLLQMTNDGNVTHTASQAMTLNAPAGATHNADTQINGTVNTSSTLATQGQISTQAGVQASDTIASGSDVTAANDVTSSGGSLNATIASLASLAQTVASNFSALTASIASVAATVTANFNSLTASIAGLASTVTSDVSTLTAAAAAAQSAASAAQSSANAAQSTANSAASAASAAQSTANSASSAASAAQTSANSASTAASAAQSTANSASSAASAAQGTANTGVSNAATAQSAANAAQSTATTASTNASSALSEIGAQRTLFNTGIGSATPLFQMFTVPVSPSGGYFWQGLISFPHAFPTACTGVIVQDMNGYSGGTAAAMFPSCSAVAGSISTSGCTVNISSSNNGFTLSGTHTLAVWAAGY